MKIYTDDYIDGYNLIILYPWKTSIRLVNTCFRGKEIRLAGNFLLWNSFRDMADSPDFDLKEEIKKNVETTYKLQSRVGIITLDFEEDVGWESTDDRGKYNDCDLEEFKPNNRCSALKIKSSCTHILAPRTHLVSIVYGILIDNGNIIASIRTIYPGVYIGPLHNEHGSENVNITERENRIFFDWNHPGK